MKIRVTDGVDRFEAEKLPGTELRIRTDVGFKLRAIADLENGHRVFVYRKIRNSPRGRKARATWTLGGCVSYCCSLGGETASDHPRG